MTASAALAVLAAAAVAAAGPPELGAASAGPPAPGRVQRVPPPGEPLRRVPLIRPAAGSTDLSVKLSLQPLRLEGPNVSMVTRSLNGTIPGAALGVPPGGRLRVHIENALDDPRGPAQPNNYQRPNTTNLHVHGWHVSPARPGDDVLRTILPPGKTWQYEYRLLPDHSPGTYWLHTHSHGSAVLQTGAGTAAPLLVLDPPGFLSPQLEAMEDTVLMFQALPRAILETAAKTAHDGLLRIDSWDWGPELWLVNGAPRPVVHAQPGAWQRLRLIAAGDTSWLNLDFGSCEVALLAKDGVYIRDFPRRVPAVRLPPGGRSDVVVRCPAGPGGRAALHGVASQAAPAGRAKAFVGPIFSIGVAGPPGGGLAAEALRPWAPASTPRYLRDLRHAAPACTCATSMGLGGNTRWMAGHLWEGKTRYLHRSPQNAVVERRLSGLDKHAYHAHNYPFQLTQAPHGDDPYFKAGDWHDTYLNVNDSQASVRFATVDFAGPQVVHCHMLGHSDKGMIAVEMVNGSGPAACGCDLLSLEERRPTVPEGAAATQGRDASEPLVVLAAALCASMVAMVAVAGAHLVKAWRLEVGLHYATLPGGPAPEGTRATDA